MQISSTARRAHRKRRDDSALFPASFAAAAAFVAATAFGALCVLPASATPESTPAAATSSLVAIARGPVGTTENSTSTILNLQIGKILSLALPDDAEYALFDADGKPLDGSKLEDKSGNDLVRLLAKNGLLEMEASKNGAAVLYVTAPRQAPQRFVLSIGRESAPIVEALTTPTKSPTVSPVADGNTPTFSIAPLVPVSTPIASAAKGIADAFRLNAGQSDTQTAPTLLSALYGVAKPVTARTHVLAQVAPPLPLLETENRPAPVSLPAGLTAPDIAPMTEEENQAALDAAAQISPNVPTPADLPAVRIPYQTRPSLPNEVARAANDPSVNRPQLSVSQGMARILAFRENILAVFFSDENVMDARAINARTLAVTGKGPGKSMLAIFLARTPDDVVGRAVIFNIDVYSSSSPQIVEVGFTDPDAARQAIEAAINDPRVNVSVLQRPDGQLVARLTGTLRDQNEINAVSSTAGLFVPNVISSLYADTGAISLPDALGESRFSSEGIMQTKLRGILANDSITITSLPGGTTLTATVDSAGEAEAILGILPYLDRKIQPIIVLRGAPSASRYYNPERPVLFGEDFEMTRRLNEVTQLDSVYAVRTARNALAIYGTVRDRTEYDRLRRYSLLLPQLQEATAAAQSGPRPGGAAPGAPGALVANSAAVTTSVSAQAPALSAANGLAPVPATRELTNLGPSNMPISGYEYPTQIQMFVRILDENSAAVRLVTVDASVVEIRRDALRDLGVQFGSATLLSESITPGSPGTTNIAADGAVTLSGATPSVVTREIDPTFNLGQGLLGSFAGTGGFSNINPFRARLAALYQRGAARVLSSPNLTAVEGSEAQITIGGSRPVPSIQSTAQAGGTSTSSVEFRRFGIILTMRPTVSDDDTIILQIRGDVTDLDFSTAINLGNAVIPGERVRSVDTTVTMREGDTLVLGGLITNEHRKETSKVPFLGDLPFIGKLFQSKRFENNETELAIFLTPSIRRQMGSENLREIIQANPRFPELRGLQEENSAFGISTIQNP